jgi:hypothetical protein
MVRVKKLPLVFVLTVLAVFIFSAPCPAYNYPGTYQYHGTDSITLEDGRELFLNMTFFGQGVRVYGEPGDIRPGDVQYRQEYRGGEWRYLGFTKSCDPYTNAQFSDDPGSFPVEKREYLKEPWENRPCNSTEKISGETWNAIYEQIKKHARSKGYPEDAFPDNKSYYGLLNPSDKGMQGDLRVWFYERGTSPYTNVRYETISNVILKYPDYGIRISGDIPGKFSPGETMNLTLKTCQDTSQDFRFIKTFVKLYLEYGGVQKLAYEQEIAYGPCQKEELDVSFTVPYSTQLAGTMKIIAVINKYELNDKDYICSELDYSNNRDEVVIAREDIHERADLQFVDSEPFITSGEPESGEKSEAIVRIANYSTYQTDPEETFFQVYVWEDGTPGPSLCWNANVDIEIGGTKSFAFKFPVPYNPFKLILTVNLQRSGTGFIPTPLNMLDENGKRIIIDEEEYERNKIENRVDPKKPIPPAGKDNLAATKIQVLDRQTGKIVSTADPSKSLKVEATFESGFDVGGFANLRLYQYDEEDGTLMQRGSTKRKYIKPRDTITEEWNVNFGFGEKVLYATINYKNSGDDPDTGWEEEKFDGKYEEKDYSDNLVKNSVVSSNIPGNLPRPEMYSGTGWYPPMTEQIVVEKESKNEDVYGWKKVRFKKDDSESWIRTLLVP